jgi:hypothetical protein
MDMMTTDMGTTGMEITVMDKIPMLLLTQQDMKVTIMERAIRQQQVMKMLAHMAIVKLMLISTTEMKSVIV